MPTVFMSRPPEMDEKNRRGTPDCGRQETDLSLA
jgi:hypothetical protein